MNVLDEVGLYRKSGETPLIACRDAEMADSLDDFLTEHYDNNFYIRFENDEVLFSFEQDADVAKIDKLIGIFLVDYKK